MSQGYLRPRGALTVGTMNPQGKQLSSCVEISPEEVKGNSSRREFPQPTDSKKPTQEKRKTEHGVISIRNEGII